MKARFRIYEIEHHGDEDDAFYQLRKAGCTNTRVLSRDYDGEESIAVECDLPEGMTHSKELEAVTELCL